MAVLNNQRVMENKKCLKPPTSSWMMFQLPDGGVHKWGYPFIAGWFSSWKIHQWMMNRGTPILGNLHI